MVTLSMHEHILWAEIKNKPKIKNEKKKVNSLKKNTNGMATMICTYVSEISERLSNLKVNVKSKQKNGVWRCCFMVKMEKKQEG